ncbi:hypothetical protein OQX63_14735 [Pedobacter sp. PF22-3]|nr:hypothetical protein [Pedobacter sp. PF22-3]
MLKYTAVRQMLKMIAHMHLMSKTLPLTRYGMVTWLNMPVF